MEGIFSAPSIPSSAADLFPDGAESFGAGLWEIVKQAVSLLAPEFSAAAGMCLGVLAIAVLLSFLEIGGHETVLHTVGTVCIAVVLLSPTNTMISLGLKTVSELHEYSKLLIPVMASALAAQGAVGTSGALYAGTAVLNTFLSGIISGVLANSVYAYLALSAGASATGVGELKSCADTLKNICCWVLKSLLYIFTGYMGITGVISGSVDAAALKAAKLTISGTVPVVGSILADASESVLAGIAVLKSSAGLYGLLAIFAIGIRPFVRIGAQYLLLKLSGFAAGIFSESTAGKLIDAFASAFGLVLGMIGTVSLLFFISTVCFLKGVV